MNSSKKGSLHSPYLQENEIFSSLQETIDDQELLIQLKKFEGKYYQLFYPNDRSIKRKSINDAIFPTYIDNFNKEWQKVYEDCQIYFYNESLSYCYSNIKRCISKIHEVFLRLNSADSFPRVTKNKYSRNYDEDNSNDGESTYEQNITKFNEEFLELKQVFNLKQYSQNFISTFKKFLKKIPKYISIFSEANIDQSELSDLLSIMQKKSDQIDNFISSIEQTQIPSQLYKLDAIIRQKIKELCSQNDDNDTEYEEPRNNYRKSENAKNRPNPNQSKNVQNPPNSFRQTYDENKTPRSRDQIQSKNGRTSTTRSELLNDIKSCSNRLKNISSSIDNKLDNDDENGSTEFRSKKTMKFLQNIQSQIDSESRFLNAIQKVDLIPENGADDIALQNERQRNKLIFDILNKGQSALADEIDTEKLKKLDNNQLISIILSLCLMIKNSNNSSDNSRKNCRLQIPLELTFCQGTREEFKRLSQQYVDTAKYNEWAESEIKKLSSENVQLKSENEILSSQLNSKENEYKLLNDLKKIDERIQFINSALEQKLQTNSNIGRPTQSLETTELNSEVEDLVKKKKKIKNQLKQLIPNEMLSEIESLRKANNKLQRIAEERIRENKELQKQILLLSSQAVKANFNGENQDYLDRNDDDDSQDEELNRRMPNRNTQFGQGQNYGQFNQDGFDNQPQNFSNRNTSNKSSAKMNRNNQFNEDEFDNQQQNYSNSPINQKNSSKIRNNQFNGNEFNGQPENFSKRSPNSSFKMNRNNQFNENNFNGQPQNYSNSPINQKNSSKMRNNQFNENDFNGQPQNYSNSPINQKNSSKMRNNQFNENEFNGQPPNYSNSPISQKNSSKMRNNQFNENEFNDQPQNFSNSPIKSSGKFSRAGQFGADQDDSLSNRNLGPTAKTAKQSQSNITDNYSRRNNSYSSRTPNLNRSGYEGEIPSKRSNFQNQNLTNNRNGNRYQNRPNDQFFEEEDENSHDDQRNHVKNRDDLNRNRSAKSRNSGFNDDGDDFYQNESEKKIKPRMRK